MLHAVMRRAARLRLLVAGLAALLAAWSGPAPAQDYQAGFEAFQAGDYGRARDIWQPLADDGDARAQYGLGVLYERAGGDMAPDLDRAAHWYARAAGQGHPSARNNLALMFAQGRGVERNPRRATELWEQAAEAGHLMAQYNLGLAYYRGEGVARDHETAMRWFRRAAGNGLADGQYAMGQMHRLGVVVPQDDAKALAWYRRAAAQDHPQAAAQAEKLARKDVQAAELAAPEAAAGAGKDHGMAPSAPGAGAAPNGGGAVAAAPADAAPAQTGDAGDAGDAVRIWLGSLDTREKARRHWRETAGRHPGSLAGADVRYAEVDLGEDGTFYRVLAGPYADAEAARKVCEAMRASRPSAFCKVMTP